MLVSLLLLFPIFGLFLISTGTLDYFFNIIKQKNAISYITCIISVWISFVIWLIYDYSFIFFQFIKDDIEVSLSGFYSGVDGLSMFFVLITTFISSVAILSNWISIISNINSLLIILVLLVPLLLAVFVFLDSLSFYIFFESILPPAEGCGKSFVWVQLSNYGDALKLLIPNFSRKSINGRSNYPCMVTSQKMKETEMGYRVSKSDF
jgi:NADH-quinone oxidoreductase subunit M